MRVVGKGIEAKEHKTEQVSNKARGISRAKIFRRGAFSRTTLWVLSCTINLEEPDKSCAALRKSAFGKRGGGRQAEFLECRIIPVISGFKTYQPQNISHQA